MRRFAIVSLLLVISACSGSPPVQPSAETGGVSLVGTNELPAPTADDLTSEITEYRIGPLDKLRIDVFGVADLSRDVQADSGGKISFPLVGTVNVNGKTTVELAAEITGGLRTYVRNPNVTVNLLEAVSKTFTIDGSVAAPGSYPVVGHVSLMRAVAQAKGTSEFARLEDVVIFRTVKGERWAGLYNLAQIRRGVYADPTIYPDDVIVVGDSSARRFFKDFVSLAPLLAAPLVAILR